jgi:uncharacterized repeat protein (TIGR02543 family)
MVASATIKKFVITATAQYRNADNTGSFTTGTTGGTTTGSATYNYGTTATLKATAATGYTFQGWYTAATGGTRVSTSLTYAPTNVTAAATYYARATINKYTVTLSPYYRNTDGTGDYTSGTTGGTVSGGGSYNYGSPSIFFYKVNIFSTN